MRMHRKPHLDERLLACSDLLTLRDEANLNMSEAAKERDFLDMDGIFKRRAERHLEIGCGKGGFVIEMAKKCPGIDFVAIEKISNVLITACEMAKETGLTNVHFLNTAAEVIPKYFPENSFSRIYLNFSNPLPKKGYMKQRLTHPKFLEIYKNVLIPGGEIWQKTDSECFFDYSKESFLACGFEIVESQNITANPFEGNVVTEHESLFTGRGCPIYRIVARKV